MRSEALEEDQLDATVPASSVRYKWLASGRNGHYRMIWLVAVMELEGTRVRYFGYVREGESVVTPFTFGGYLPRYTLNQRGSDLGPELLLGYLDWLRPDLYDVPNTVEAIARLWVRMQVVDPKSWFVALTQALEPYGEEAARLRQDIERHATDDQVERLTNHVLMFLWERR